MPDILTPGGWERVVLPDVGALELNLVARRTTARLDVVGTTTSPKYLGQGRAAVAFPARAVGAQPVVVRVVAAGGTPFEVEEQVDLVVSVTGTEQSWSLRGLDVAGQLEVALVRVERDGQGLVMRPGEGGSATLGLGGWCVRRREELGLAHRLTVSGLVVDTSRSMRAYQSQVQALEQFLSDMALSAGVEVPVVRRPSVAGAPRDGVGAVQPETGQPGRWVLVTDTPPAPGQGECLLLGPADLVQALPTPGALALSEQAWAQLERSDRAFGSETLDQITPLLDWLTRADNKEVAL